MAYQPLRTLAHGDVITTADWNSLVHGIDSAHRQLDTTPTPEPQAPGLVALAGIAAVASASQKPISRRSLLGLWRRK